MSKLVCIVFFIATMLLGCGARHFNSNEYIVKDEISNSLAYVPSIIILSEEENVKLHNKPVKKFMGYGDIQYYNYLRNKIILKNIPTNYFKKNNLFESEDHYGYLILKETNGVNFQYNLFWSVPSLLLACIPNLFGFPFYSGTSTCSINIDILDSKMNQIYSSEVVESNTSYVSMFGSGSLNSNGPNFEHAYAGSVLEATEQIGSIIDSHSKEISERLASSGPNTYEGYSKIISKYNLSCNDINDSGNDYFWKLVRKEDTINAYSYYLNYISEDQRYSDYSFEAKHKLIDLSYQRAMKEDTYETYTDFVNKYSSDGYAANYVEIIKQKNEGYAYKKAQHNNTIQAYEDFIKEYPNGEYNQKAKQQMSKLGYSIIAGSDMLLWKASKIINKAIYPTININGTLYDHDQINNKLKSNITSTLTDITIRPSSNDKFYQDSINEIQSISSYIDKDCISTLKNDYNKNYSLDILTMYIFPNSDEDRLSIAGTYNLRKGCMGGDVAKIEVKDTFFTNLKNTNQFYQYSEKNGYLSSYEITPIIYYNSKSLLNGFSAYITQTIIHKITGKSISTKMSIEPCKAYIRGTIKFPEDRWIRVQDNIQIRGGGLKFTNDGIFLISGTEVIKD